MSRFIIKWFEKGIGGNQSSLVDEIFRILEKSNIDYVVIENVKFMLHLNKGEAMKKSHRSLNA